MQAPIEFNAIVHTMAHKYCPLGYDLGVDAPQSLAELRDEIATRARFTVSAANSANTIFSEPEFNHDFRAWHDATHYAIGAEFTLQGELEVALRQIADLRKVYGANTARRYQGLIFAEVIGQALAYELTGAFPVDQPAFDQGFIAALYAH